MCKCARLLVFACPCRPGSSILKGPQQPKRDAHVHLRPHSAAAFIPHGDASPGRRFHAPLQPPRALAPPSIRCCALGGAIKSVGEETVLHACTPQPSDTYRRSPSHENRECDGNPSIAIFDPDETRAAACRPQSSPVNWGRAGMSESACGQNLHAQFLAMACQRCMRA